MKKMSYLKILVAAVGILGLGLAAKAELRTEIVVTLPFEFVASGQTLPAGTYTVSRFSDDKYDGLILNNYDAHTSVIVRANEIEGVAVDKPEVTFEQAGERHYLSAIQTTHYVYNIPVSRSVIQAAERSMTTVTLPGSSGGN
jgi:hypothetical protein